MDQDEEYRKAGSVLEAIAYVKVAAPPDDEAEVVEMGDDDAPIFKSIGGGLLVAYLLDEGDRFTYVQGRHLRSAGLDADQLHAPALANLAKLAEGRVTVRQSGPTWTLLFDGNFEASLILLDRLWDGPLRDYHAGQPVVAVPTRDVLCFCDSSSPAGVAGLRSVIQRLWPDADHLLSDRLFRRRNGEWIPYDAFS
jgi:uncharacterized protein YtpQ (UPF0354 family)